MNTNVEINCEYNADSFPTPESTSRVRTSVPTGISDTARFGDHIQSKVQNLLQRVLASPEWKSVENPAADARYVKAVMKHVLLEVFSYGPHVTEATFTAIGRFPKDRPDLMKLMILHDIEEAD